MSASSRCTRTHYWGKSYELTAEDAEKNLGDITGNIVDAAMKVHTVLGPGLLESTYETCLKHELIQRGHKVATQVTLPIRYDDIILDAGYRIDMLVEDTIVLELKSVETILPIHEAQLLSYLRLSTNQVGILINFNVIHLKDGIKRMVNNYRPPRSSASSAVK
jgi:GxxExxY protein